MIAKIRHSNRIQNHESTWTTVGSTISSSVRSMWSYWIENFHHFFGEFCFRNCFHEKKLCSKQQSSTLFFRENAAFLRSPFRSIKKIHTQGFELRWHFFFVCKNRFWRENSKNYLQDAVPITVRCFPQVVPTYQRVAMTRIVVLKKKFLSAFGLHFQMHIILMDKKLQMAVHVSSTIISGERWCYSKEQSSFFENWKIQIHSRPKFFKKVQAKKLVKSNKSNKIYVNLHFWQF